MNVDAAARTSAQEIEVSGIVMIIMIIMKIMIIIIVIIIMFKMIMIEGSGTTGEEKELFLASQVVITMMMI